MLPTYSTIHLIASINTQETTHRIHNPFHTVSQVTPNDPHSTPPPSFADCAKQSDVCLLLDASGSINDGDTSNWASMLKFAGDVLNYLPIGMSRTRASVITFSDQAQVVFQLDDIFDKDEVRYLLMLKLFSC